MALIDCAECGKQVSTLAASCPSCGAPVAGGARWDQEPVVTSGLLGKLALVFGAWIVTPWVVRLLAFLAGIVMLIVMFRSSR
ncbi:MAG: zinc ribbon domain-containing protein [Burkholderiales bacterium]